MMSHILGTLCRQSHAMTRRTLLASTLILAGLCAAGCSKQGTTPTSQPADTYGLENNSPKLQVGMITVAPVSDWGFNYQHNQGRLGMEARMRDKVHTVLVENVPETADVDRVMQRMCDAGAKLILATSYGYQDSALRVAGRNPGVTFMHCLGNKQSPNFGTYSTDIWEPAYVSGVVTAMTLQNETKFGFVGAHPIPPINWTVDAFALGAQSVNPAATVNIVYTNSWNDPAAETEAVKSLAAQGVKAVYVLVDSPIAGVQAAERAKIYALAHHADLSSFAPTRWLTGSMWQWSNLYVDVAQQILDGTWKPGHFGGGFKKGYVALAPFGPDVKGPAQEKAREVIARISSGELNVFAGPISDNSGKLRVPAGQTLSIEQILGLDWLVKGVHGAK